jgi:hypothetical protein
MPGADIAAQAVPDDCGRLPPLASFSESCSELVSVPCRATVMSAPMRVSQNGVMDCVTDTDEVPFGRSLDDQEVFGPSALFAAALFFGSGPASGHRSVSSRLQSSLLTSMSFMMSTSLASGATSAASSVAAIS